MPPFHHNQPRVKLLKFVGIVVIVWLLVIVARFPGSSSTGATAKKKGTTTAPVKKATTSSARKPTAQPVAPVTPNEEQEEIPPPVKKNKRGVAGHKEEEDLVKDDEQNTPEEPVEEEHPKKKAGGKTNLDSVRRQKVVEALKHSWNGYKNNAFGKDEFFPNSKRTNNWGGGPGVGVTIIDALDTLLIAGLQDEADEAMEWIKTKLSFNQDTKVSFFETTIRVLGGLLSAYERTGEKFLLNQAKDLATRLAKGFDTPSGIPDNYVNLRTGRHEGANWNGGAAILSELGSLQMEFRKLSDLTGDSSFDEKATKAVKVISKSCGSGFCPRNFRDGRGVSGSTAGLGSFGDSFYEYLLKVWIMSDKKDPLFKNMWDKAAQHVLDTTTKVGDLYIPNGAETGNTMEHLACFSGGLFALSYLHEGNKEHLQLAERIANTCHEMYITTRTKLAPDVVQVHASGRGGPFTPVDAKYILRPETVETYFYLWRVTHDKKYRDWGFEILEACNKYLKVDDGYVGSTDVYRAPTPHNDNMETFWFAETLKYLYYLFSEDEAIDLREWVFNTEAHPFKVMDGWHPSSH